MLFLLFLPNMKSNYVHTTFKYHACNADISLITYFRIIRTDLILNAQDNYLNGPQKW